MFTFKQSPKAYERYAAHFGAANHEISVANHSLVFFDAPRYVDEDSMRHGQRKSIEMWKPLRGGSYEFVRNFSKSKSFRSLLPDVSLKSSAEKHTDPVILFSHIPMYRPDGKGCGPLRERGTIRPGAGEGYQNTMEKQSTRKLLEIFNPEVVFR